MKTFLLNIPQRLKLKSQELDVQATLCNKAWIVFNDDNIKQLFIFQPDGTLYITVNGRVFNSSWQYISANSTIIITFEGESRMFHPAFLDDVIFALQQDGDNTCLFMIDERNQLSFSPKSLAEFNAYFIKKEQYLDQQEQIASTDQEDLESTSYHQVKRKYSKLVNNERGNGQKKLFEEKIEGLFLCEHILENGDTEYWYEFQGEKCSDIYEKCSSTCYDFILPVDNSFLILYKPGSDDIYLEKWDVYFKDATSISDFDKDNFEYRFPEYSHWKNVLPYEWTGAGFPNRGDMYLVSPGRFNKDLLVISDDKAIFYQMSIEEYSSSVKKYLLDARGKITTRIISERRLTQPNGNATISSRDPSVPSYCKCIRTSQFRSYKYLTSLTVPDTVTKIEDYAFEDCSNLISISLPNTITELSCGVFKNCDKLSNIIIPNSVRIIDIEAFSGCRCLSSIVIPNSVEEIWHFAFCECSGLTSIEIPNSVSFIGQGVFEGCSNLQKVMIQNRSLLEGTGLSPTVEIISS